MRLLICNLAPGIKFRQDTLNTLKWVALDLSLALPISYIYFLVLQFARRTWRIARLSMNAVHTFNPILTLRILSAVIRQPTRSQTLLCSHVHSTGCEKTRLCSCSTHFDWDRIGPRRLALPGSCVEVTSHVILWRCQEWISTFHLPSTPGCSSE